MTCTVRGVYHYPYPTRVPFDNTSIHLDLDSLNVLRSPFCTLTTHTWLYTSIQKHDTFLHTHHSTWLYTSIQKYDTFLHTHHSHLAIYFHPEVGHLSAHSPLHLAIYFHPEAGYNSAPFGDMEQLRKVEPLLKKKHCLRININLFSIKTLYHTEHSSQHNIKIDSLKLHYLVAKTS